MLASRRDKEKAASPQNYVRRTVPPQETGRELVDAGGALPVDDVDQFPRILIELELNLTLFVHGELASGIEDAGAFALVGVVDVELAGGEVKGLRLRVGVD